MTEEGPSKNDISAVFKKLRSAPSNKVCFDCGAKNPTWSSVTYGVFICIDCSAIHRGLGVHVSFVRSTQLDTNWTWLQLRAMQVGGNANATQFFRQHSCTTTDAQQKYKSRAAQLYKEKLHQQAVAAMRLHGYRLHLDQLHGDQMSPHSPADREVDFFDEHTKRRPSGGEMIRNESNTSMSDDAFITASHGHSPIIGSNADDNEDGPKVDDVHSVDGEKPATKSVIGQRKPTTGKKVGQSAGKKGGLGAQKVDANFSRIEKEAESIERANLQSTILNNNLEKDTKSVEEVTGLSARLMVRDIGDNVKKRDEQLKQLDPKKYEQADRLGMGTKVSKSGVSHSVFSDMKTIQQEGEKNSGNFDSPLLKSRKNDDDDWEVLNMEPVSKTSSFETRKRNDEFFDSFMDAPSTKSKDNTSWLNTTSNNNNEKYSRSKGNAGASVSSSDEATKKFGNAKAISSDQFFGDKSSDFETRSNFARFEGQSAISSADFFGGNDSSAKNSVGGGSMSNRSYGGSGGGGYGMAAPDIADIKDSVRQGVTKVAGKLSALSSSVSNYMGNYS